MKILLGDDHQLFRDGLQLQLQEFDPDLDVYNAASFLEVFSCLQQVDDMELALIDLGMPGIEWKEGLRKLAKSYPCLPVVVVSGEDSQAVILETLDLGVAGYIPKTSSGEVMINAIRLVLAGGVYLPREVLANVGTPAFSSDLNGDTKTPENTPPSLTPRQQEVLVLIADGKSNKQIASLLGLSDGTIKTHISSILRTLNANNRTQAILTASRMGILRIN